jgi:membrane-associated protease RseP (regulator of RpoE activity)
MAEHRFSARQVLGMLALVLSLCAASLAGGVALGYQWGRATGRAAALAERAGRPEAPDSGLPLPFEWRLPFQDSPARPYLGVEFEMITPELAEAEALPVDEGALIRSVAADTPAEAAGLRVGDIVQEVEGEPVDAGHSLRDRIMAHQPGDQVALTILRGGETLEVTVTLAERPASPPIPFPRGELPSGPGFRFEFRCTPEPCPFQPFFDRLPRDEPTY